MLGPGIIGAGNFYGSKVVAPMFGDIYLFKMFLLITFFYFYFFLFVFNFANVET